MRPPDRVHVYCMIIVPMFAPRGVGVRLLYYGIFCIAKSLLQTHLFHSHSLARTHSATHGAESPLARCRSRVPRIASIVLQRALIRREDTEIE